MKNKYINFVLCGDKNFIVPITVAITSILTNINKSRITRFFLLTTDFSDNEINTILKLKKKYNFELINIDIKNNINIFDKIDITKNKIPYVSLAAYYRLLMFKILPEYVDKCFYIDGDMIIDTDLSITYDNLTEEKLASVIVEPLAMQHRKSILSHCYKIDDFKNFKNDALEYPYFNTGLFLVNIKLANELNIFEKMFDFLNRFPNPPYADQDILNAVIGQKYSNLINYLEPSYNVFCDIDYEQPFNDAFYNEEIIKASFKNPKVYHYAGANKPWINTKVANYYDIWWKYLKLSPYRKMKNPKDKYKMANIKNKISKILSFIFSKKSEGIYNIITIFGIKITLKNKFTIKINDINRELENINFQLFRITPKANIDFVEIHLTEHCNLNCQCCSHFSQLAESEFANIEVFERDIKRLSELSNGEVNIIHLMGGEPLLNPNCERFFELTRKYFDKTEIKLITNGILLLKQNDSFWQSMKNNNITLAPTKYPIKIDWGKIKDICDNMNIKLKFYNDANVIKTSFYNPLNLEGNENPEWNFRNCFLANNCLILDNGKLYTCSYIPNIRHFNKFFNKNIPISVNDYIDIHKARNYQEILQFLAKPIPFCKYCDVNNRKDGITWKVSTKRIEEYLGMEYKDCR